MRLNEIKSVKVDKQKIGEVLKNLNIEDYMIQDDGSVGVNSNVNITKFSFEKLPVKFGKISGSFQISQCQNLKTLEGCPDQVTKAFSLYRLDSLSSLKKITPNIGGDLNLYYLDGIKSLKYLDDVKSSLIMISNCKQLTSLAGCPKKIQRLSIAGSDNLTSIDSLSGIKISHLFLVNLPKLKSLNGLPPELHKLEIKGLPNVTSLEGLSSTNFSHGLNIEYVGISSLKGIPEKLDGFLRISECDKLTTLEHLPKFVKGSIVLNNIPAKNILQLLKIKRSNGDLFAEGYDEEAINIIKKHIKTMDILGAQEELIGAGLEKYARIK